MHSVPTRQAVEKAKPEWRVGSWMMFAPQGMGSGAEGGQYDQSGSEKDRLAVCAELTGRLRNREIEVPS